MRITTGTFPGEAGKLEYILNEPEEVSAAPVRAALVCHPHPLYGGTMHTRIVFQATQALGQLGWPVLRFHFRGVGKSEGSYDRGKGERDDVKAALAFLRQICPAPVLLAGFSFGASMVTRLLAGEARGEVAQAVLMGLPVDRQERGDELPTRWAWQGPKLMISGDHDEFASVAALDAFYARLDEPKARQWIAGGDHFMAGKGTEFQAALRAQVQVQANWVPA